MNKGRRQKVASDPLSWHRRAESIPLLTSVLLGREARPSPATLPAQCLPFFSPGSWEPGSSVQLSQAHFSSKLVS